MVNKLELELAIIRTDMTKKEVAEKMHISRMTLYNKMNNRTKFRISEIERLCKILNLDKEAREKIFFV